MQAAHHASRRPYLSFLGMVPAALVVALAVAACSSSTPDNRSEVNPTDPACRAQTCSTLGKNCGIISDGCGGSLRCGTCSGTDNDCRNNVCERGCQTNAECPNGASCINGSCSDKCADSRDCPSGQYCNNGSCAPNAAQSCGYDSQCRNDERCTNGYCLGNNTGASRNCTYDSECRGGERCQNNICTGVGGRACRYASDCSTQETCTNGYCSSNNGGQSCRYDQDCGYNSRCSYGVCRPNDGYNGRVRARCIDQKISFPTPFGSIGFSLEHWLYDERNSSSRGIRVDSCICRGNGTLHAETGSGNLDFGCSRCIVDTADGFGDSDERTCYE
jgi:hypothetical protein